MEELKRSRISSLSNLTKKINKLVEIQDADDVEEIRNAIHEMRDRLKAYQIAHGEYHEQLKDDHDIEISRTQYRMTLEKVERAERQAFTSLKNLEKTPSVASSSRASSTRSSRSVSSFKAQAAAKKRSLEVKSRAMPGMQEIELEQLKLRQRKAKLELASDIEAAEAERKAYEDAETEGLNSTEQPFSPTPLGRRVTPSHVTRSNQTHSTAVTQSMPISSTAVTQYKSISSTAVMQSMPLSSTAVTQFKPIPSTAVTQSKPILPTAVMQSKPISSTAVTQSKPISSTAVTQSKPISSTAVTQSKPISSTAVPQSKPISSTAVPQSKPISSTAVTQYKPISSTAVTQSKPISSTAVTQYKPISSTAVTQSKPISSTAVTQNKPSFSTATIKSMSSTASTQYNTISSAAAMQRAPTLSTAAAQHKPSSVYPSAVTPPNNNLQQSELYADVVTHLPVDSAIGMPTQYVTPPRVPMNYSAPSTVSVAPPHYQYGGFTSTPNPMGYENRMPFQFNNYPSYYGPNNSTSLQEELVTRLMESQERQNNAIQGIVQRQQESVTSLTLPQPSLTMFSGDPAEYTNFIKTFELLIESRTPDPSSRLLYLVQYTSGQVQELMRSCLSMKGGEGYARARQLLKERYGQDYRIATALVQKIAEGPPIKSEDSAALQRFATNLTSCTNTLREIGCIGKLDSQDNLQRIIQRLPYGLRLRWRDVVDSIVEREGRDATIDDVTDYVSTKARAASHPVFGKVEPSLKSSNPQPVAKKQAPRQTRNSSFSARISEQQPANKLEESSKPNIKCPLCNNNHWLSRCEQFRKRSVEERIKFVLDKKLCNNCLSPGHFANACSKDKFCKVEGCTTKHSSFLHLKPVRTNGGNLSANSINVIQSKQSEESKYQHQVHNGFVSMSTRSNVKQITCLAMVPVRVRVPGGQRSVDTYAFLDNGSNATFMTTELMKKLGPMGSETDMLLSTLQIKDAPRKSTLNNLEICDLNEENGVLLTNVLTMPFLPVSTEDKATKGDISSWKHLKDVDLIHIENADVGLLIGSDNPEVLQPLDMRIGEKGSPYATKTILGWTVNGPLRRAKNNKLCTSNPIRADVQLSEQFERFCNLEFNDREMDGVAMSRDDVAALQIMESSAELVDSHYEISMPWKHYPPHLENNRIMAETRLQYLKKKLQKDEPLRVKYTTFIDDMISKGQARPVPTSEINNPSVFYLPHHNVVNPQKPEKCRVVWDCAAKWRGTSLNDQLLRGPDLTNTLVGVLTRFREEPIAIMADVEGMFHQVRVKSTDRDYLRFLWWPDGDLKRDPEEYQMLVHLFGATSSPSCANFALKKTAKDNATDFDSQTIETVHSNFYVDDCLKSVPTVNEAKHLSLQLRTILSKGGFRLTKWISNSKDLLRSIPKVERASSQKNLDFENPLAERTLGVRWDVQGDQFGFEIKIKERPATRRGLLSMVSSVYDPLGFVSPVIHPAKFILQELCRKKLGWDDPIPAEDNRVWQTWIQDLHKLEEFTINRCLKPDDFGVIRRCELHHFSDASEKGYGAASYLRLINELGRVHCTLVMAKSRLAPLKTVSIPRLELSAAVLATRLDRISRTELTLQIDSSTFWTDSTCVLQYLANKNRRFQVFVANRIAKILDRSNETQWRHVDTELNPADEASRGLPVDAFLNDVRWIEGPSFLYKTQDAWPRQPNFGQLKDDDPEVKAEVTSTATTTTRKHPISTAIERSSSWNRLRRVVAWMLRYRQVLLTAARRRKEGHSVDCLKKAKVAPISITEINEAEFDIIKCVQTEAFMSEILTLESSGLSAKPKEILKGSPIYKLDPILTDGLVRVGGRLTAAPIDSDAKHPIILPKGHALVNLIVMHYHRDCGHSGQEYTLALIRQRYWVINARASVRGVLNNCVSCKRRQAPAVKQKMASLPRDRVTPSYPPFTYTGVDLFGPYEVQRGRSTVKRYGVLFTCLTIRAIHIEVASSLDTDSFINALRRFTARRGQPKEMRSDNGGNFVKGERELREAVEEWNQLQIHDFLTQRGIKWTFNPPAGSHHGGVWERCIRTVRKVLRALVHQQTMNEESLSTLMCEVESIVNGRPITKVSDDPRDPGPLTPNHLLMLHTGPTVPPGKFLKYDSYGTRRWRQVQYLADVFWKRWVREYLPALQERHKWNALQRNIAVNDIVLVLDNNTPRSTWPLARVLEVYTNRRDGLVRSVKLKTKTSELVRPISKIVLLEAANDK